VEIAADAAAGGRGMLTMSGLRACSLVVALAVVVVLQPALGAQAPSPSTPPPKPTPASATQKPAAKKPEVVKPGQPSNPALSGITPPAGYVIGPEDVLAILFWRDKDMSVESSVRPDGMITVPLINDVKAAGLTPEQLREQIEKAASQYVEDPSVTVAVKQINSRRVFVTGNVAKPGPYPLISTTTVLQLISMAGGLTEYADEKGISVMRVDGSQTKSFKFNYKDVIRGKKLEQNIELRPGDTVVVP
jgi:polysaccharide export outer membrane protein